MVKYMARPSDGPSTMSMKRRIAQDYFDLLFATNSYIHKNFDHRSEDWIFDYVFSVSLEKLKENFKRELKNSSHIDLETIVIDTLVEGLKTQLSSVISPVLRANHKGFINRYRQVNPQEFTSILDDKKIDEFFMRAMFLKGIDRFFEVNVFLRKTTLNIIESWLENSMTLLTRIEIDRPEILKNLAAASNNHLTKISNLEIGLSDSHNNHQTVVVLEFDNSIKVVYKPRPLNAEQTFYKWVTSLKTSHVTATQLYCPWIVSKETHGWMEYIKPLTTSNSELTLKKLAKQFAWITTLWYLVGGTDLHVENIVMSRKGIVVVDAETIFEADLYYHYLNNKSAENPSTSPDAAMHSLISTQALTSIVSDLNSKSEKLFQMGGVTGLQGLYSQFRLHSTKSAIKWAALAEVICDEIELALLYFKNFDSTQLLLEISEIFSKDVMSRIILRPTSNYIAMLENLKLNYIAAKKPHIARRYMSDQLKLTSSPGDGFPRRKLKSSEIDQLLNYDVPYFRRRLGANKVYNHQNVEYSLKEGTDFRSTKWRLKFIQKPNFIKKEIEIIRIILDSDNEVHNFVDVQAEDNRWVQKFSTGASLSELLKLSKKNYNSALNLLADRIICDINSANEGIDAYRVVSFTGHKNCVILAPNSYSLFVGLSGKLLFLAAFAHIMNRSDIKKFVSQQLNSFLNIGKNKAYINLGSPGGIASGFQSLLYVKRYCEDIGINTVPLTSSHIAAVTPKLYTTRTHDLISYTSGNIILATQLEKTLPPGTVKKWAKYLLVNTKKLSDNWGKLNDEKRIGLAHGALGPCFAVSRLEPKEDIPELRKLVSDLVQRELEASNRSEIIVNRYGWCYGEAGRAIAYYHLSRYLNRADLEEKAHHLTHMDPVKKFSNHSLCCGSLGFIASSLYIDHHSNKNSSQNARLKKFFKFYENPGSLLTGNFMHNDVMPSNLFYGLAGYGLVLLYCLEPDSVPAVWAFE